MDECKNCHAKLRPMQQSCPRCGTFRDVVASSPTEEGRDDRCCYSDRGSRCPALGTMASSPRAKSLLCREHYVHRNDAVKSREVLENYLRNGPPRTVRNWRDELVDARMFSRTTEGA